MIVVSGQITAAARLTAEIEAAVQASASMAQAMSGFIGTFITGIIVSGIIAIWVRAKPGAGSRPQRTMA